MHVLNFKKLHDDAILPTRNKEGDAGLDLYSIEDVEVPPSEVGRNMIGVDVGRIKVPTGISVQIPFGFYGKICGRSGLAFDQDIECFEGTIDSPYRGELGVMLKNFTSRPYFVRKGDRVAQLVIMKCELPTPVLVDELGVGSRGVDGYGSSGR